MTRGGRILRKLFAGKPKRKEGGEIGFFEAGEDGHEKSSILTERGGQAVKKKPEIRRRAGKAKRKRPRCRPTGNGRWGAAVT